jgi:hypothetical protein
MLRVMCLCGAIVAGGWMSSARAADYGTIEGQFILDGAVPSLPPEVTKGDPTAKDAAVCAAEDVPNELLVVDPTSKGIANIAIYLRKAPANVHPDLKASKEKEVKFNQKGCRFEPHMLIVRTDQTVKCVSEDGVAHNLRTSPFSNQAQNFTVPANDQKGTAVAMSKTENVPVKVQCDIHQFMDAFWVVTDNPYAAVTDKDGKFKIENLPVGTYEFTVWQEDAGYINRKFSVTVKAGDNQLPVEKVALSKFKNASKVK